MGIGPLYIKYTNFLYFCDCRGKQTEAQMQSMANLGGAQEEDGFRIFFTFVLPRYPPSNQWHLLPKKNDVLYCHKTNTPTSVAWQLANFACLFILRLKPKKLPVLYLIHRKTPHDFKTYKLTPHVLN